jgi:hypothetical protein
VEQPYLVMEYAPGRSLTTILSNKQPLSLELTLEILTTAYKAHLIRLPTVENQAIHLLTQMPALGAVLQRQPVALSPMGAVAGRL